MVVEIANTPEYDPLRHAIDDVIYAATHRHVTTTPITIVPAIPAGFVGWKFYDGWHVCATHPKEGCQHGQQATAATLWEVHPVVRLELP